MPSPYLPLSGRHLLRGGFRLLVLSWWLVTQSARGQEAYDHAPRRQAPPGLLAAGPMVGYSTTSTVGLWVQLTRSGGAQIEYWIKSRPTRTWRTAIGLASGPDFIVHLEADSVQPGQHYEYRLRIADDDHPRLREVTRPYPLEFKSQPLWQWRRDPPDFRLAVGSCNYVNGLLYERPGPEYGGQYAIFQAIAASKPDLMLWLGDNTYLREADWDSPIGIRRRYAQTRALPELQPLLGSVHHYALWDDHDYGPDNADRTFPLKDASLETFRRYWMNPTSGLGSSGIATTFSWADVQFFLLDDRWNRTPNADDAAHGQILGPEQLRWLIESLVSSKATFKVIAMGGQILNPARVGENYANYRQERAELLRRLAEIRVPGIVLLSGDRHHAELTILDRPGLYPLYELTTSPLTAGVVTGTRAEPNTLRDTSTYTAQRNFALLDVSGPVGDRRLLLTLCNVEGQPVWKRELRALDLRPGAPPRLTGKPAFYTPPSRIRDPSPALIPSLPPPRRNRQSPRITSGQRVRMSR